MLLVSSDNRIGTNSDGISDDLEANVISGNRNLGGNPAGGCRPSGVFLTDSVIGNGLATDNNLIAGNFIGTDRTGLLNWGTKHMASWFHPRRTRPSAGVARRWQHDRL